MPSVRVISDVQDLSGKRVLLRSSLNVPVKDGAILDATRIDESLETIAFLRTAGARILIVSHTSDKRHPTLRPVYAYLCQRLPLRFIDDIRSEEARTVIEGMRDGDVVLAENLRMYPEEEANDRAFARELASLADIFVNDDFTVSHRAHAAIVSVPEFLPSYAGLVFAREYSFLSHALDAPTPSLAIIGGAKPETKLPLIAVLAKRMTEVFVCGVSANTLWQSRGLSIGHSMTATQEIPEIAQIDSLKNIATPSDVRVIDASGNLSVLPHDAVPEEGAIVDAGPETLRRLAKRIAASRFILWNGPLGEYDKGYTASTHALARSLAASGKRVIVGGGDTAAAIRGLDLSDRFTYLSTSGGAMIDFLVHGTLPGIEALQRSS